MKLRSCLNGRQAGSFYLNLSFMLGWFDGEPMTKKMTIVFSGGGSGGHVLPALTLVESIAFNYPEVEFKYIGGVGIESRLVRDRNIPFYTISTGKLRRYFSWQNFTDIFRIVRGVTQSYLILRKLRSQSPQIIVFTTGGFVTVPVAIAAWLLKIPLCLHEQTSRAGLANRIVAKFANRVFISFEESRIFFPPEKVTYSGYPVREECQSPPPESLVIDGLVLKGDRPILFLTGGGNGSTLLNAWLERDLDRLREKYIVIHQVGRGEFEKFKDLRSDSYLPLEFIDREMIDLMKLSSIIISRAGAGTVSELLAMGKRSILIPLKIAQKNEQYYNAMEAVKQLNSLLLEEEHLEKQSVLEVVAHFEKEDIVRAPVLVHQKAKGLLTSELISMIKAQADQ